jgi:hypothetical protein
MSEDWEEDGESPAQQAERIVTGLVRLAGNDEAGRLLGVEGTLEEEVDVTFLNDPLTWIANEVASAIRLENDESEGVPLSTLVALLRLYRVAHGTLDEHELRNAVVEILEAEGEED